MLPRSHKSKTVRIISPHSSATDKDPTYRSFSASGTYERARSSGSESDEDYEDTSLIDPFDVESDDGGYVRGWGKATSEYQRKCWFSSLRGANRADAT